MRTFLFLFFVFSIQLYGQPEKLSSGKFILVPKKEAPQQPKGSEEKTSEVSSWLKNYQKDHPTPSFSSEDKGVDFTGQYRKQYDKKEFTLPQSQTDLISNVYLRGDFQRLHIPLKVGFNKIEIKALNQGLYGPNTAEFRVIDDNNQVLINQTWALLTGYKARFVIVKDK